MFNDRILREIEEANARSREEAECARAEEAAREAGTAIGMRCQCGFRAWDGAKWTDPATADRAALSAQSQPTERAAERFFFVYGGRR